MTARNELVGEFALLVEQGVRLGDVVAFLLKRRVELDLVVDPSVGNLAIRCFDEAELVDPRVGRQRRDESDVRPLRRFDRANTPVVGRVNVPYLESCSLAGQAARAQRREATLVRDLGQRVGLIHELGQLRRSEVFLDHRRDRLRVDQVVRHQGLDLLRHAHALFDGAFHPDQTDPVLVLHQFADRTHAPVTQVVDIVDRPLTVLQVDEIANGFQDVALGQHDRVQGFVQLELVVQLQPTHLRQVVALGVEEQVVEQVLRGFQGWRIAGTQAAIDLEDSLVRRLELVRDQGIAQVRTDVEVVDEQNAEAIDPMFPQLVQLGLAQLLVALKDDLAGLLVDNVRRGDLADQVRHFDRQTVDLRILQLLDRELGELSVLLDQDLARFRMADVATRALARQQIVLDRLRVFLARLEMGGLGIVVVVEQLLGGVTEGAQQYCRVQLAPTIDPHVEQVLGIELEVQPRPAVRNNTGAVQQLPGRMGLALVVIVKDTGAAVQLADDHPLGSVDDERTVLRHQGNLAEEDLLLLHVADRLRPRLFVRIPDNQAHDHFDGRRERHSPLSALVDVVLRLVEGIRHVLQRGRLGKILDRKDALEDALQTQVLALVERGVLLQELLVALLLNVDEIRDIDNLPDLREAFPSSKIILDHKRHRSSFTH